MLTVVFLGVSVGAYAQPTYYECLDWAKMAMTNEHKSIQQQARDLVNADVASFPATIDARPAPDLSKAEIEIDPYADTNAEEYSVNLNIDYQDYIRQPAKDASASICETLYGVSF